MSAPSGADPRAVALFGPIRRMDEIDASREVSAWLEAAALSLPRIPNEEIKTERNDFGVRVYWRDNRPHVVMLTIRDGLNFTFGIGFDLPALAAAESRASAALARAAALEAELLTARGDALEEAARVVERGPAIVCDGIIDAVAMLNNRAARIRALRPEPGK